MREIGRVWPPGATISTLFDAIIDNKNLEHCLQTVEGTRHPKSQDLPQQDKLRVASKRKYDDMAGSIHPSSLTMDASSDPSSHRTHSAKHDDKNFSNSSATSSLDYSHLGGGAFVSRTGSRLQMRLPIASSPSFTPLASTDSCMMPSVGQSRQSLDQSQQPDRRGPHSRPDLQGSYPFDPWRPNSDVVLPDLYGFIRTGPAQGQTAPPMFSLGDTEDW